MASAVRQFYDILGGVADAAQDELLRAVRDATPVRSGRARDGWYKDRQGPIRIVRNDVPYIRRLNDGYSLLAPRMFVQRAKAVAARRMRRRLRAGERFG